MRVLALVLVAACYQRISNPGEPDAPSVADASPDAPLPPYCFNPTGLLQICVIQPLRPAFHPLTGRIDTNDALICDGLVDVGRRTNQLCAIAATSILIDQPVHVVGSRALVLLSSGSITISAQLDADSKIQEPGAGQTATCPTAEQGGQEPGTGLGAGGGAGGSFGTQGASGGDDGVGGGRAGISSPVTNTTTFDVGQNGGAGGDLKLAANAGGSCGLGGGGLYLYARGSIAVSGSGAVTAFGLGGFGGVMDGAGGGGGGSGGMIVLEATSVMLDTGAVLGATGGGGGGGKSSNGSSGPGQQASASSVATAPMGGTAVDPAGVGGAGSTDPQTPAVAGTTAVSSGGGGGGGGAGVIRILPPGQTFPGVLIYPPAT